MTDYLPLAADLMMIAASLGAAAYCFVLSRRLSRLASFDGGIGGAIAVLSRQVDEMKAALSEAKAGTAGAGRHLEDLVRQATEIAGELELMIASCHDFAEEAMVVQGRGLAPDEPATGGGRPAAETSQIPAPADPAPHAVSDARGRAAAPAEPAADPVAADAPVPVFGSRRAPPVPVFRRHAQG